MLCMARGAESMSKNAPEILTAISSAGVGTTVSELEMMSKLKAGRKAAFSNTTVVLYQW
jgi:hypothetical protein